MKLGEKIENLISPIINALGYELWGVELSTFGKSSLVRIYIDTQRGGSQKSISIDDCGRVSSHIGALLDVEGIILNKYNLEVSSPGLNRRLFKLQHYELYIGSIVNIHLYNPVDNMRNFVGKINSVSTNNVELLVDDKVFVFELANIAKANLNFNF